jgi:heme oxygenase (biliverdin-IX-beta and delta-forming)
MEAHQDVEKRLCLPDSITSLFEYEKCLLQFHQLYLPLEMLLLGFSDWRQMGFESPVPCRSMWLTADLKALGVGPNYRTVATEACLPSLPVFANAVGALYVLEGSALGSQYILPPLQRLLGQQIVGADAFFRGRGDTTGAHWKGFRARLDEYGAVHPKQNQSVIAGAIATFESIGTWMRP